MKLHATVINTKYRGKQQADDDSEEQRTPINAKPILQKFGDFSFGEIRLSSIEISERAAFDSTSKYWKSISNVNLP